MLDIQISNQQTVLPFDAARLEKAAQQILAEAGIEAAELSLAIVDDLTIHRLNREFLEHDYPTDVLSFLLEDEPGRIEGEVIASADTAIRSAAQFGWSAEDELLLYVIHGTLHLVGFDDLDPDAQVEMRAAEARVLRSFGLEPRY